MSNQHTFLGNLKLPLEQRAKNVLQTKQMEDRQVSEEEKAEQAALETRRLTDLCEELFNESPQHITDDGLVATIDRFKFSRMGPALLLVALDGVRVTDPPSIYRITHLAESVIKLDEERAKARRFASRVLISLFIAIAVIAGAITTALHFSR